MILRLARPLASIAILIPFVLTLTACGGDTPEPPAAEPEVQLPEPAEAPARSVWFAEPADGAEVEGPDVRVVLEVSGIDVMPVAEGVEGSAHHHLFINQDVTPMGQVIPANVSQIVHMGDGSTEYVIRGLPAGEHRIIAVLADLLHIPLDPPAMDTITITVTGSEAGAGGG